MMRIMQSTDQAATPPPKTQRLKIAFPLIATRLEHQVPELPPWPAALEELSILPACALVEVARLPEGTAPTIPDLAGYFSGVRDLWEEEPGGIEVKVVIAAAPSLGLPDLPVRGDGVLVRAAVGLHVALWRQQGSPAGGHNYVEVLS